MIQPIGETIRDAIDLAVEDEKESPFRDHLGASVIGTECVREIFYSHRWAHDPKTEGRMLRLWKRGHHEEARFLSHLSLIDAKTSARDPKTGKQYRMKDHGGHYGGSCDGQVWNLERFGLVGVGLLEFKTHAQKYFTPLLKKGVAAAHPSHYIQMQEYMAYFNNKWALYCALNKNTEEYHFEVVEFNNSVAYMYSDRARKIIEAKVPPPRLEQAKPSWYKCKMCDFSGICFKTEAVNKNCRTCRHLMPVLNGEDGEWFCSRFKATVPLAFQRKGCNNYEMQAYYRDD
jgi:hypothetical protein